MLSVTLVLFGVVLVVCVVAVIAAAFSRRSRARPTVEVISEDEDGVMQVKRE